MTIKTSLLFALCISGWQPLALAAGERVALVIGNSVYQHAPQLRNPKNDAEDISAALMRVGFDVIKLLDADKQGIDRALRRFRSKLDGASVALFYYSGHALQVKGENYLAPVNAALEKEADLDFEAVSLKFVLKQMQDGPETNLVFLDACRDNPLTRSLVRSMGSTRSSEIGRGLKRIDTGIGTLIAYATQPDNVALDGTGRYSPFTEAVLKYLEQPGLEVQQLMTRVTASVAMATGDRQIPWRSASLRKDFYFVSDESSAVGEPVASVSPEDRLASASIRKRPERSCVVKRIPQKKSSTAVGLELRVGNVKSEHRLTWLTLRRRDTDGPIVRLDDLAAGGVYTIEAQELGGSEGFYRVTVKDLTDRRGWEVGFTDEAEIEVCLEP